MDAPGPREAVLGSGAGGPLSPPDPWITYPGYLWHPGGIAVGVNQVGQGPGSINAATMYINGVLVNLSLYFPYTGGTFTGMITLAGDPTSPLHPTTKRYVDNINSNLTNLINSTVANYLPLAGGTMTGPIALPADPTAALQAATKQYVDSKTSGAISIPDAPNDGNLYGRQSAAWAVVSIDAGTY